MFQCLRRVSLFTIITALLPKYSLGAGARGQDIDDIIIISLSHAAQRDEYISFSCQPAIYDFDISAFRFTH